MDLVQARLSEGIKQLKSQCEADDIAKPIEPQNTQPVISGDDALYQALRRLNPFRCDRSEMRVLGFGLGLDGGVPNSNKDELIHIVS